MRFSELIRSYVFRPVLSIPLVLVLVGGLLVAGPTQASELDVTVLVSPGAEFVDYLIPVSSAIDSTFDPVHGELIPITGGVRFEPGDDFWEVGSDVTHLSLIRPTAIHRIRWVAGETGTDGDSLSTDPACSGSCTPWTTIDEPENPIWFGSGVLGGNAARFNYDPAYPQTLRGDVDDAGSSGSSSTTSDFQVVIDDIGINRNLVTGQAVKFYSVIEGPQELAVIELETRWNDNSWQVRPVTTLGASTVWANIDREVNQIQLLRWTEGPRGGIRLKVNDVVTHQPPAPPRVPAAAETHELLMETHTDDATNLQLQFEDPVVRTSGTIAAFQPVTDNDNFSTGTAGWNNMGHLPALGTQAQTLPGSGLEFRVDLDAMDHPLQSAYLEKGAVGFPSVDADGWAYRFWIDPSTLTLDEGTYLTVMTGCFGTGPCSQLRVRLEQKATGLELVTTAAADDQGAVASLSEPLSLEPHVVEVRFRTAAYAGSDDGMVEVRVDGNLVGRADDLQNYDHPIGQVRLGALGVPAGATGVVAFDAFESWRFD